MQRLNLITAVTESTAQHGNRYAGAISSLRGSTKKYTQIPDNPAALTAAGKAPQNKSIEGAFKRHQGKHLVQNSGKDKKAARLQQEVHTNSPSASNKAPSPSTSTILLYSMTLPHRPIPLAVCLGKNPLTLIKWKCLVQQSFGEKKCSARCVAHSHSRNFEIAPAKFQQTNQAVMHGA